MSQAEQPPSDDENRPAQAPHLSARVPPSVSQGVFSSGMVVVTGAHEFVLDFVQNIGQPPQVAARIVMPHAILPQFIQALQANLEMYTQNFGPLPKTQAPASQTEKPQPSVQDLYDELKLSDESLSGAYANGVMIVHTASEFKFDFLTNLIPHSAVSARVFLAAPQAPRVLDSLTGTYQQFQQRRSQQDDPPSEEVP